MKKTVAVSICGVIFLSGCCNLDDGGGFDGVLSPAEAVSAPGSRSKSLMLSNAVMKDGVSAGMSMFFQQSSRQVAYTSGFTLTVKKRDSALDEVRKLAESLGGYLVSSNRGNMQLKIPVNKADEFLAKVKKVGKFSDFRLSAEDLTDVITDLDVRLENLRKLRQRLTELLKRTSKVDELLKVERELNRVTTEIERIDARLQNNRSRVANVTFEVAVIEEHGAIPGGTPRAVERFPFLRTLASASAGTTDEPLFGMDVPEGFVPVEYGTVSRGFAATSSDDCIFRTWEREIPADSTLEFWGELVCRALSSLHKYDQIKKFPAVFNGRAAIRITAQVTTSRGLQLYMAVIAVDRFGFDELQIVEFFGPEEAFKKHESKVLDSVRNCR